MRSIRLSLSVLGAILALAATATAAFAATPGLSAWHDKTATWAGALPAQPMSITMVLAPRNEAQLDAYLATAHPGLSTAQYDAQYAPTAATVGQVRQWAKASDLRVTSVSANNSLVTINGTSTAIAQALNTKLANFTSATDGNFYAPTRAGSLPANLAPSVAAVVGLTSLGKVRVPQPATQTPTTLSKGEAAVQSALTQLGSLPSLAYPAQYGPQQFWSMYDAPSSDTGSGQQLAIITEGNVSQPKADLATFEQKFGLPAVTWNQINVGTPSSDTSGDDEWDLDSQYSTGFAPGVSKLDVYVGPSLDDSDILTTIDRWVTDDIAKQGSFSAGECDILAYVAGFSTGLDTILKQADAQGQSMFFASGDTGSQCPAITGVNGVPAGIPDTDYPASSPYGIGVGGTSVLSPSGPVEIGWYAGGGGLSPIEPVASFQASTKVLGTAPLVHRGVPDVSLDADPESGYEVIVDGSEETIGGTSASTPSWQGIWARVNAGHSGLGFAGPILYQTEPRSAFHDITIGSNGLYTAGPGYDLVTGLGTADIAKLVAGA